MRLSSRLAALFLAGATLVAGCAEKVKDVDRVQPYFIKKSMLQGQWYYRQTIVDVPPQVGIGFTGIEGKLEKVKWDIRHDILIARRVHEAIPGLDENQDRAGADRIGSPVISFGIRSHFDILRDFDRQTGEQSNVVSEDTSINTWNNRQYMRVDWAAAEISGPVDFTDLFTTLGSAVYTIPETDAFDPDQLQIEDGLIEFTTRYDVWDGGYTCAYSFGYWPNTTNTRTWCGGGEVKVRHSFVRIDPEDAVQFQPRPYLDRDRIEDDAGKPIKYTSISVPDGHGKNRMVDVQCTDEVLAKSDGELTEADCRPLQWDRAGRFGFFRVERHGYTRRVGPGHDENRQFLANQHKIWEQVYEWEYETNEAGEKVIAHDENGQPKIKRDADGNPVVIPMADRKVRPITYYLNVNFPDDLKDVGYQIGDDWDDVFIKAIAAGQGKTEDEVRADIQRVHGHPNAFRVLDNTCSLKGVADYVAKNPSIEPVVAEATGDADVLPGNLRSVCAALTHFSRLPEYAGVEPFTWQQIGDMRFSFINWVNEDQPSGPLGYGPSSVDSENGRILSGNANIYGAAIDGYARSSADVIRAFNGDDDVQEIIDSETYDKWVAGGTTVADESFDLTSALSNEISRRMGTNEIWGADKVIDERGNFDKAAMMRHLRRRMRDPGPNDPLSRPVTTGRGQADVLIAQLRDDPELRARLIPEPILALAERMIAWAPVETQPEDVAELAIQMTVDPTYLGRKLRERNQFYMNRNVFLPEFIDDSVYGQALELRGQDPELVYKTLRDEIFRAVTLHEVGHTVGLTHNFKGSFDALNYPDEFWKIRANYPEKEWTERRLPEFRYSTIMDYGARFNSDTKGLGKYDYAAIKFAYAHQVETFKDSVDVPGELDVELEVGDYRDIPKLLGGGSRSPEKLWDRENTPIEDVIAARREGVQRNAELYVQRPDRRASDYWTDRSVPFFYCSDAFRGDLKCRTWDEGASHEEAVESAIQRYWNYYFFNAWRRGRQEIPFYLSFFSRQGRLREYLTYPFKYLTFYDAYRMPDGTDTPLGADLKKAAIKGINFINQILGAPEPGSYCIYNFGSELSPQPMYIPTYYFNTGYQRSAECRRKTVALGLGRDPYPDLSDDYPSRWDYMGSFYDKVYLTQELFNDTTAFFRVSDESDLRRFDISYYQVFQPEIIRLMSDVMWSGLGSFGYRAFHYYADEDPVDPASYTFRPNKLIDPETFGTEMEPATANLPQLWVRTPYDLMRNSLLLAMLYNSHSNDRQVDFAEYVAITEAGSGEDRQYAEGTDIVRFTNPKSGATYVAAQTDDGNSMAHALLRSAKSFAEGDWADARRLYEADPENPQYAQDYEDADQTLEFYLGLVEDLRMFRSYVDYR